MTRLRRDDLDDPETLKRIAAAANLSVDKFRQEFEYLIKAEPPPLVLDVPRQNAQRA